METVIETQQEEQATTVVEKFAGFLAREGVGMYAINTDVYDERTPREFILVAAWLYRNSWYPTNESNEPHRFTDEEFAQAVKQAIEILETCEYYSEYSNLGE